MSLFKALLVAMFLGLLAYTGIAVVNDGFDLVTPFFSDLTSLKWPGQFNADFLTYLWLSALWIAWRHKFSGGGIVLALVASVAGILFFSVYLLVSLARAEGDMARLLLGEHYTSD
ncbi:MAG: hypothetical protein NXH95_19370 [Pseudomonadaceae bacterium]|nr:hypothetical protein [Pseudomonadaceae bacterium]